MADNTNLNASTTDGDDIRTKDRAGTKTQILGLDIDIGGASEKLMTSGQKAMADSIPVVVASNQSAVPVSAASLPLPTGAATSANQSTIIGHVDGIEALLTTIDADTSNLAVVGGGTEAAAVRVTIANNSTGVLSVDDNGAALTVDNGGTFPVQAAQSGTWTVQPGNTPNTAPWLASIHDGTTKASVADLTNSNPLHVAIVDGAGSQITSFGGGTQYTETDTDASITGTAMMWEDTSDTLRAVSSAKPLPVNVVAGGAGDGAILDGVSGSIKATVLDFTNANPLAVNLRDTNGDYVSVGGGTQYTEDDAAAANPVGTALMMVRDDVLSGQTTTDGDNVAARGTDKGELYVKHVDAIPVTDNGGILTVDGTVSVTGVSTLAEQQTQTTALQLIDDIVHSGDAALSKYAVIGAVFDDSSPSTVTENNAISLRMTSGRALHVAQQGAIPAGTNNIGDVDVLTLPAIPAGTNNIGDVDVLTLPALPAGNNNIGDVDVASIAAGDNNIGNVDIVSLPALPAGNNNIGDVDVASLPASTNTIEVVGDVAQSVAAAGNPVLIAASHETMADSAPSNRVDADADATRLSATDGALFVIPTGPQMWSYHDDDTSAVTTDGTVHAAPSSGLSLYVTDIVFSIGVATASSIFFEESTTKVLGPYYLEAIAGRGLAIHFGTPKKITAATALLVTNTGATTFSVDVTGFIAPG